MGNVLFAVLILICLKGFGQAKANPVYDKLNATNYLKIEINIGIERYQSSEINLFYKWDEVIKAHTIFRNNTEEYTLDTSYVLTNFQLAVLDKFSKNVLNNVTQGDILYGAGCYTEIRLSIDTLNYNLDNKRLSVSLAEKLLGKLKK